MLIYRTFATVTKAITKWKLQTKAHSRAMRQQKLQQRINERKANEVHTDEVRKRVSAKTSKGGFFFAFICLLALFRPINFKKIFNSGICDSKRLKAIL